MANHKSSKKRILVTAKKNAVNNSRRSTVKTAAKKVLVAVESGDKAAATIKEAVERVRERGKEDVESAEELLQNHLSEYEKERIEIEKSDETIDPAVLERATGRIVERICTVDAFGA